MVSVSVFSRRFVHLGFSAAFYNFCNRVPMDIGLLF